MSKRKTYPSRGKQMLTVEMYVDELASCVSTPDEEYMDIEEDLRRHIFGDSQVRFKCGVTPKNISPSTCIYVIDFGALSCYGSGQEYVADRLSRELITSIDNYPSTYFILWSSFTVRHYQYIACEDKGLDCLTDLQKPANVFLWEGYSREANIKQLDKIRQLLGLPVIPDEESRTAKRTDDGILSPDEEMDSMAD